MTKRWFIAVVTALLTIPTVVFGACPNKCSGHGKCGLNDVCQCMQNWIYGDCSGRQCPFTRAWSDTAQGNNDAHYYAECGNRGTCDRATGECTCDAGFVGSGCRRMQCPNDCSGHGTCEFIEELATDTFHTRVGGTAGVTYQLWDQEKIMGCVCDAGYEGHDCSLRVCPKGDDPLTSTGLDMVQAIVIDTAGGTGYLTYYDPYGNAYTTDKITFGAFAASSTTCANIQTALQRLPNNVLNTVSVVSSGNFYAFTRTNPTDPKGAGTVSKVFVNANGNADYDPNNPSAVIPPAKTICFVEFTAEPGTTGYQKLLGCNIAAHATSGQHPISAGVTGGICTVMEVYYGLAVGWPPGTLVSGTPNNQIPDGTSLTRPLTELVECSNRGTCDYSTGACTCFAGHMGSACQNQEALV